MHYIRAFIGKSETVKKLAEAWSRTPISLPQDCSMVFLTDDLFNDITELFNEENILENKLEYFASAIGSVMEEYSHQSMLAYIETDYFGGTGEQGGVLYVNSKIQIAPTREEGFGIINVILSEMGIYKSNEHDEFDSIELGNFRRME